jgi:hypothetical protein
MTLAFTYIVFSLLGVVLIARPPFLFGLETDPVSGHFVLIDSEEKVTPAERLLAVGYALHPFGLRVHLIGWIYGLVLLCLVRWEQWVLVSRSIPKC